MSRQLHRDDRGVSTVVTHILAIGITSLLVISLLFATGSYLEDQRELVAESELQTIGNRLANEVVQVDNLNTQGGNITLTSEHPDRVAGQSYDVALATDTECRAPEIDSETCLVLTIDSMDVRQVVALRNETAVRVERVKPGEFRLGSAGGGAIDRPQRGATVDLPMDIGVGRSVTNSGSGRVVDVSNAPPFPKFAFAPGAPHSSSAITFNASAARDIDGDIVRYYWNFRSDEPGSSWQETSSQFYNYDYSGNPGYYNVSLAVEDEDGAISNTSAEITIAGLEYNRDIQPSGVDSVDFTMTNNWSSYDTEITSVLIDPPDYIDEFDNNGELQIGANTYDLSNRDIPDGGIIVPISGGYSLSDGATQGVTVRNFDGTVAGRPIRISVRHEVDGQTNNTIFTDVPNGVDITDYRLTASGQDVDLTFNASEELSDVRVNLKGAADDDYGGTSGDIDLYRSDFTEQYLSGPGVYEYTADVAGSENGNFVADLVYVESTGGQLSGDVSTAATEDSVVVSSPSGYLWSASYHWDGASSESNVVHDSFGDHEPNRLELGYKASTPGLLTYYPFDEDGGDTAADVSGNGHDADHDGVYQEPQVDEQGVVGSGYEFYEWAGEYVVDDDANAYLNGQDELTISAWVKSEKTNTNRGVMIGEDPTGNDGTVGFRYDQYGYSSGCGNCLKAGFSVDGSQTHHETDDDTQTTDWQHVVVTWESGDDVEMYLDGSLDTRYAEDETGDISDVEELLIGMGSKDVGGNWDGNIDEVRIYDQELSATEVQDLYETPTQGSLTTAWQSGTSISYSDLELQSDVDLAPGDDVEVVVESDKNGDGTPEHTSDPVDLVDGTNTEAVTGLPGGSSSEYRLAIDIQAGDVTNDPSIRELKLQEDS